MIVILYVAEVCGSWELEVGFRGDWIPVLVPG